MRCADAQNLASSHASLPDWRGSQGNKLLLVLYTVTSNVLTLVFTKIRTRQQQLFKFKDSLVYCLSTNVSLVLLMSHYECNDIKSK